MNPQPQQEMNDQELIEQIERNIKLHREQNFFIDLNLYRNLLTRFKALTADRTDAVERCVEAVMNAIDTADMDTYINSTRKDRITTALKSILTPEKK